MQEATDLTPRLSPFTCRFLQPARSFLLLGGSSHFFSGFSAERVAEFRIDPGDLIVVLLIVDLRQQCVVSCCAEISAHDNVCSKSFHVHNSIEIGCQLERSHENPAHADCPITFEVEQGFCFSYMRELAMGLVPPPLTGCI
ncbi:hypothetical protein Q7P35_006310 [Cladosporium inversicolor]